MSAPVTGQPNLVREAGGLAAARLGIRVLGLLVGWVVARVLGPEGLGQLSMPNLVLVALPFLTLGFPDALVRELPLARGGPDGLAQRLRGGAWFMTLLLALGLAVLFLVLQPWLGGWFSDPLLLRLAILSGVCHAAFKVSYCDLNGSQRIRDLALLQFIQGALRGAVVLLLLFTLPESAQVYALHAGVSISLLAGIGWAARHGGVAAPRFDLPALRLLWRSGPPLALASLALLLLVAGDRLVMSRLLPLPVLGLYEQGVLLRDALLLLPAVLLTVLIPDYTARQGDPARRPGLLADVARQSGLVAVGAPVLLGLGLLQLPWLISLLLPRFLPGVPLFQLAALGVCPLFLSYILVSLLMSEGRAARVGLLAAACLALMLGLDLLPPPAWLEPWLAGAAKGAPAAGLDRALWGALVAFAGFWSYSLVVLLGSARRLDLPLRRVLGWLAPSLALGAVGLLGLGEGWLQEWNPWVNLAALAAAALLLGAYETRSGQLSKVWRARRAPKR
jgi:O-antigen/teichoic acid export membrane protein